MPISHHTRRPDRSAAQASWMALAWPATIVLAAVIVFTLFWQSTPATALAMALATLLAGGILLTAVYGTVWINRLRDLLAGLGRKGR